MSGCSPSPRPTGSMPAGPRRNARASAGSSMHAHMWSARLRTCQDIAAWSPCLTAIPQPSPGLGQSAATAYVRSASNISAKPDRLLSFTATTGLIPMRLWQPHRRSRRDGRFGISGDWLNLSLRGLSHSEEITPVPRKRLQEMVAELYKTPPELTKLAEVLK